MVGRDLTELFPRVPHEAGEPILVLEGVRVWKTASPASLVVRRGEIVGIAGLGRERAAPRFLRALFGLAPVVSGLIRVHHHEGGHALPRARIAQGVGFLSEDRKTEGLALSRSIEDNVTYSSLKRHARHGWLRLKERRAEVARWLDRLHVTATGPSQSCRRASRAATSKRWRWRGCCTSRPTFCFSTSRRAESTSGPRPRSIA